MALILAMQSSRVDPRQDVLDGRWQASGQFGFLCELLLEGGGYGPKKNCGAQAKKGPALSRKSLIFMARPRGFEPLTSDL